MLKSKLLTVLFVTILILILAEDNEADAEPVPCLEFFGFPNFSKHKNPKDDHVKRKEEKRNRMKERSNLFEKFFQSLFTFK